MIKIKFYYDKDLCQKWLNEMCDQGWAFESYFFGICTFSECEPGKYYFQIDLLKSLMDSGGNYKEFMRELKIEPVQQWFRWIFLRKRKTDGAFELYTDDESLIRHYAQIRNMFKIFILIQVACLALETMLMLRSETRADQMIILGVIAAIFFIILMMARQILRLSTKISKLKGKLDKD